MKLTKMLLCGAVAGVVALFSASTASAAVTYYPSAIKLNISGKVVVPDTITTNGTTVKGTLKTVSFNNKSLISLLNASPTVQSYLTNLFGSVSSNSIPAGSYFVWDMNTEDVWITNKNGFSFNVETPVSFYIYWDYDVVIGSAKLADVTGAGSEIDQTGVEFYFDDYNGNYLEPEYGGGVFNWTYGTVSSGVQKKTISVTMTPAAYYANVDSVAGITTTFSVSGSGSSSGLATFGYLGEPFFYWY